MASRGLNCHSTGVMSRRDRYNYRHSLQPCRVLSDSDSDVVMRDGDAVPDIFIDDAAAAGSESDCRSHVFQDFERESSSLRGFQSLRESQQLIDVTLSVDGQQFSCHRALLASASEYFCCLFTTSLAEQNQAVITISGVDANSMRLVLDYVYTGRVELNSDTVQNLLSSANLFQLRGLRDGCADYMERKIEIDNCIGVHFFAQVCCTFMSNSNLEVLLWKHDVLLTCLVSTWPLMLYYVLLTPSYQTRSSRDLGLGLETSGDRILKVLAWSSS